MSHRARLAYLLAVFGTCTVLTLAQVPGGPPPEGAEGSPGRGPGNRMDRGGMQTPPRLPLLTALDANGDGELDAVEVDSAPAALKRLDADRDGKLSPEEYLPKRPGGTGQAGAPPRGAGPEGSGAQGGPPRGAPSGGLSGGKSPGTRGPGPMNSPLVRALDTNGDGILDAGELAGATRALWSLDANGDRRLSGEEIRPARPGGSGPGRRP